MYKGSFDYKQDISGQQKLVRKGMEEKAGKRTLRYAMEQGTGEATLLAEEEKPGLLHVKMESSLPKELNRFWLTIPTDPQEHFYGCGETYAQFDLKGQKIRIWVAEHQSERRLNEKLEKLAKGVEVKPGSALDYESYYVQPTFVSSGKYFLHVDTDTYCEFDFSVPGSVTLYLQEEPDFYIGYADSFEKLSELQSSLLGRQKELPDWIYDGAILAIQGGTQTVEEKIQKAQKAGVKVNGVWSQDWCGCRRTGFGYQVMWNWQWDSNLYPGLDKKIKEWNKQGIHYLGYINTFLALEGNVYKEASEKGYCVKDKDGNDYHVTITTFPAAMIDLTNPDAYEWYKGVIRKNMIDFGLSGWMADFGEYLPMDAVLYSGEDPYLLHNRWPAIWAKLNKEAIEEAGKQDEIFFFTRAGYTQTIQDSTMMWTGDQHVDWSTDDGLPSVIPASLSLAMSGYGISHSDVGGYTTKDYMHRDQELLMRWEEMNVFSPLFRSHEGNQPTKNVQFDQNEELLKQLAHCSRMHALLKPYLQELVQEEQEKGTPVMRPLFYYYDEPDAYTEKTEYLLGRDLLVAPVCQKGVESRVCYLPKDEWVHVFSGKTIPGGEVEVEAPIGEPPVFVRKGSTWYDLLMQLGKQ